MTGRPYGVNIHYENGAYRCETHYLNDGEEAPDITKLSFESTAWMVQIGFEQPLEHELQLRPGAAINPQNDPYPFYANYFIDARITSYDEVRMYHEQMPRGRDAFDKHVRDVIRYGVDYAGYAIGRGGLPVLQPKDMFYAYAKTNVFVVLSENAAVLTRLQRRVADGDSGGTEFYENGKGMLWRKSSPLHLRYGL